MLIQQYLNQKTKTTQPVVPNPEDFRNKSHFWSFQPLLRTNPAFGLSRQDAALAIGHFNPDDLLAESRRDYAPYVINQGMYNSQEPEVEKSISQLARSKPR